MYDSASESLISKYASVFWLMLLFPSETVMPAVGYAAANGHIGWAGALAAGVVGSVLGSFAIYLIFRQLRSATSESFVRRYGKFVGISPKKISRAGGWFDRHGNMAVFASRFVPAVRSAMCMPAGLAHMPGITFLAYALAGTLIDSALLLYMGYVAGDNYEALQGMMREFVAWGWAVVLGMILLLIITLWEKRSHAKHSRD